MIHTSATTKDSLKKWSIDPLRQISKSVKVHFRQSGLLVHEFKVSDSCYIVSASTLNSCSSCPDCGSLCFHVHKYYIRTLASLELLVVRCIINCDAVTTIVGLWHPIMIRADRWLSLIPVMEQS